MKRKHLRWNNVHPLKILNSIDDLKEGTVFFNIYKKWQLSFFCKLINYFHKIQMDKWALNYYVTKPNSSPSYKNVSGVHTVIAKSDLIFGKVKTLLSKIKIRSGFDCTV